MYFKQNPPLLTLQFLFLSISIFLHTWKLDTIPNGFFIDEASIGYNALCIAETGADEYGNKHPILFRCFDNYHDTTMVYCLAPMVKYFGLTKFVTRLPSALFIIAASIALYFLILKYLRNKWVATFGAFIFSVLPWIFPISRTTMSGYTPMLLGMIIGWLFLFKAFSKHSYTAAFFSALGWSFAMYSHNCGRPMTAIYLIIFGISMNMLLLKRVKILIFFSFVYIAFMLPLIFYVYRVPISMVSRFNKLNIWHNTPGMPTILTRFISRYIDYFSPDFLFFYGDKNFRHNSGGGELYYFLLPLLIIGLCCIIKKLKTNVYYRFLFLGFVLFPVAASLTLDKMHSTRSVNGSIFFLIIAVIGLNWIWSKRKSFSNIKIILVTYCILGLFEVSIYLNDYYRNYNEVSSKHFESKTINALQFACSKLKQGECLYISGFFPNYPVDKYFKPYFYSQVLFFRNIPPKAYQTIQFPNKWAKYYHDNNIDQDGILLTGNCRFKGVLKNGQKVIQLNKEKLPQHILLKSIPVSDWRSIFVYRVFSSNK